MGLAGRVGTNVMNGLKTALTTLALLTQQACGEGPVRASGQTQAFWDGTYAGLQVPDAVQHNTRAGCLATNPTRQVTIRAGEASLIYPDSVAKGEWGDDGDLHLTTPNRAITLTPLLDAKTGKRRLFGRVLVGGGPWCKFTLNLLEEAL